MSKHARTIAAAALTVPLFMALGVGPASAATTLSATGGQGTITVTGETPGDGWCDLRTKQASTGRLVDFQTVDFQPTTHGPSPA